MPSPSWSSAARTSRPRWPGSRSSSGSGSRRSGGGSNSERQRPRRPRRSPTPGRGGGRRRRPPPAAVAEVTEAAAAPPPTSGFVCPVPAPRFIDRWGAPRSGGRSHQGVDMMASTGTPIVASVSGTVQHRSVSLGGLSYYLLRRRRHTYFGTHLSGYAAGGRVAGTVIGYVGDTGNARHAPPALRDPPRRRRAGEPVPPRPPPAERDGRRPRRAPRRSGRAEVEGLERLSGGASRRPGPFVGGSARSAPVDGAAGARRDGATGGHGPRPPSCGRRPGKASRCRGRGRGRGHGVGAPYLVVERSRARPSPARSCATTTSPRPAGAPGQCGRALAAMHRGSPSRRSRLETSTRSRSTASARPARRAPPGVRAGVPLARGTARRRPRPSWCTATSATATSSSARGPAGRARLGAGHVGDPMEDLGWLCVKAWRFGAAAPVGGFGEYEELFAGLRGGDGRAGRPRRRPLVGGARHPQVGDHVHHAGRRPPDRAARSVELAAIGRRVCENEHDLLLLQVTRRHDPPTAAQLVEAVREFLRATSSAPPRGGSSSTPPPWGSTDAPGSPDTAGGTAGRRLRRHRVDVLRVGPRRTRRHRRAPRER